jgi:hypothetical protein
MDGFPIVGFAAALSPAMKGGRKQTLLWPGGSGGARGSIGREWQRIKKNTDFPQFAAGGLGPRPGNGETSALGFRAGRPSPQGGVLLGPDRYL